MKLPIISQVTLIFFSVISSLDGGKTTTNEALNGFLVTWAPPGGNPRAFDPLPKTEKDALNKGWTKLDDGCTDPSLNYNGTRYILNNEYSVMPVYDGNGNVAGIQSAIPRNIADANGVVDYKNLAVMHQEIIAGDLVYCSANYFTDPANVCKGRTTKQIQSQGTLDDLFIRNGKDIMAVPRVDVPDKLKQLNWSRENCVETMGLHYYLYVTPDMNCADMFPMFLMYDILHSPPLMTGFGYFWFGNYTSTRFEEFPKQNLGVFVTPVPNCLPGAFDTAKGITAMHVFFYENPQQIGCPNKTASYK